MPSLTTGLLMPLGAEPGDREERESDERRDPERDDRPVRHLGREEHPDDQDRRRHEIEEPVREDRAHEHRARPGRRVGEVTAKRRDARELARGARARRVGEQSDTERGEDVDELRLVLGWKRLPDGQPPRERPEEGRDDVQEEREDDPAPDHDAEGVQDLAPFRARATRWRRTRGTSATIPTMACVQPERRHGATDFTRLAPAIPRLPSRPRRSARGERAIVGHE